MNKWDSPHCKAYKARASLAQLHILTTGCSHTQSMKLYKDKNLKNDLLMQEITKSCELFHFIYLLKPTCSLVITQVHIPCDFRTFPFYYSSWLLFRNDGPNSPV